jgi:hypothetical protein
MLTRTPFTLFFAGSSIAASMSIAALAHSDGSPVRGPFRFQPLATSTACDAGGAGAYPAEQPFVLPPGFIQTVIAREGDGGSTNNWDMNTLNETGRRAGQLLYRTHETPAAGQVTVTDLATGATSIVVERADWNRLDGIVWTPWHTLLVGEEMRPERLPSTPAPEFPAAQAGLVYEVNPVTGSSIARPALGAKAHEGIRIDPRGNVYGISETGPTTVVGTPPRPAPGGYIFKFVPDQRGDMSSGQLYALKIVASTGDRTGKAVWIPLDRTLVTIDADQAATQAGATGYGRPEDVEMATSTGNNRGGGNVLYVAVTDEHRVLRIDLREPRGGREHSTAFVSDYVRQGVNAPADFSNPDNLALDKNGNLYITEDTTTPPGMDIWVAVPNRGPHHSAEQTVRFASLTDCGAEPSGIYFDQTGTTLYVNVLHRSGPDPRDLGMAITQHRRR